MPRWFEGFAPHVHVHPIAVWRRFAMAGVVLVGAYCLGGREFVAQSLVLRGDDVLRTGDQRAALRYYDRAIGLMPSLGVAVDRVGFAASMSGDTQLLRHGIAVTSRYLASYPGDEKVRWDRAICERHLGAGELAYRDLRFLARETSGRRDLTSREYATMAYLLARREAPVEAGEFAKRALGP
jgi:hypothetical protein